MHNACIIWVVIFTYEGGKKQKQINIAFYYQPHFTGEFDEITLTLKHKLAGPQFTLRDCQYIFGEEKV